jgi:hypothetical protein
MSNTVFPALVKGLTFTKLRTAQWATINQSSATGVEVRIAQAKNPLWTWTLIYDYIYGAYNSPNNTQAYAPYTDLEAMLGFFLARQGQSDDFLFSDPSDNSVGPAMLPGEVPNPRAQLQTVNDGVGNYYSPIQRSMGGFLEDITDLNGAIQVYSAAGTLLTSYSVGGPGLALPGSSFGGLYLQWNSPAAWVASHTYALGAQILDHSGHIQQVTTAGTSGSAAPGWNDNASTTTDGTAIWTDQGYNPGPGAVTAQFSFYFRVRFAEDTQDFEQWAQHLWTIGGANAQQGAGTLKLRTSRPAAGSGYAL